MFPTSRPVRRARSICGRPVLASNTSTASSAPTPTNGILRYSRKPVEAEEQEGNNPTHFYQLIADHAIACICQQHVLAPDKPGTWSKFVIDLTPNPLPPAEAKELDKDESAEGIVVE